MYTGTTDGFNNIISGTSRHFYCKLSRAGEEHTTGFRSVKITLQANPDTDNFSIGGTVSALVEVQMDKPQSLLTGKEFQLSFGLEVDDEVEWCPMCVVTAEKPKEDCGMITFTAYDRMVTVLNYPYYTDITSYPVDAKVVLQEISTKTGISIENLDSLPNGIDVHQIAIENEDTGTYMAKNPFAGCTYREAVKYIAQLYGMFATMNRTGKLEFRWYSNTDYTIELNRSMDDVVLNEEEYEVQRIICAAGKAAISGTDVGFVLNKFHSPVSLDNDGILSVGEGTTGITMENPVMDVIIMEKIWAKIGGFKFTPATVSFLGDCRLDLGDIVTVKTRDGSLELPIISMEFEFDGGLSSEIGSYGSTEMQEASAFMGNSGKIVDYVNSEMLRVNELLANKVNTNYLLANYATIKELNAVNARIDSITSTDITVEYLEAHYAQIDMANVDTATIRQGFLENLMVSQGVIADRVVGTEVVATDVLTGVNIYADDITAGTLSVDRLVLRGTDKSLVYALNNSGELVSTQVDTLDAYILTDRTITADKIVAESITSTEINVGDLVATGFIGTNRLTANNIQVNDLNAFQATIGGFTIGAKYIANNTDVLAGASSSVYVGLDGISCGQNFIAKADGTVTVRGSVYMDNDLYLYLDNGFLVHGSYTEEGYYKIIRTRETNGAVQIGLPEKNSYISLSEEGFSLASGNITVMHGFVDAHVVSSCVWEMNSLYCNDWFRSNGKTGWYNQDYGGGIYMTDTTWVRVSHNKQFLVNNTLRVNGEVQTTAANSYRMVYGNYGTFWRNDGGNLWLLFTNSGDQYGGYNSLRPFSVNLSSGFVTLGNGCSVGGNISATGTMTGNSGVYWGSERCVYGRNNTVQWFNNPGGNYMEVNCNNGTTYGVTWFVSDARLKKDIEETPITALDYIKKIEHKQFGWIDEERRGIRCGYVAQQLEEVGLDVVYRIKQPEDSQLDELYQIDGTRLLPYMTKAIQELSAQIEELKNQIVTLQQGAV